jgi:hypothetical protein
VGAGSLSMVTTALRAEAICVMVNLFQLPSACRPGMG